MTPNQRKNSILIRLEKLWKLIILEQWIRLTPFIIIIVKKKSGQISIISSVAGYRGLPAAGAYCASKSALTSFTESLHFEMKRKNVRVSLVSPGFIKTPMTDQNDFPMPMIKPPEFAAEQIYIGLVKKKGFEIHFPKAFTYFLKFLSMLPSSIYFKIVEKGMKKIDY